MSTPVVAFFNNKGGVGKTSLVYHLAWMYAGLGVRVVAVDFDPQANLSAAFLDEERLATLWSENNGRNTVWGAIEPLLRGTGDVQEPYLEPIDERLGLLVGDLALSGFEDQLSEVWPKCLDGDERSFRVISAFWRVMQQAAAAHNAEIILMDLGPNLGAINRAALISSDFVVVPLSPDLFSLQGLRNLGPRLRRWREEWQQRLQKNPVADLSLPAGVIAPIGYIVLQPSVRLDRPVKAYQRWIAQMPSIYQNEVLHEFPSTYESIASDTNNLALMKHYQGLMPLAQEAHKPIFHLKPADGASGAHTYAVQKVYDDFKGLAMKIAQRVNLESFPLLKQ